MAKQAKKPNQDPSAASPGAGPGGDEGTDALAEAVAPPAADTAGETAGATGDAVVEAQAPAATGTAEGDIEALRDELAALQAKADEYWDRLLRTQAEMENLRKRSQRDVENAHKFALEGFANELLGVRDSLEMGLAAAAQEGADAASIREGTELTLKMLVQVMEKFNIEQIDPLGEKFDPALHQAMTMLEEQQAESNTVVAVIQKGYTLNGRLLRPALVTVAR